MPANILRIFPIFLLLACAVLQGCETVNMRAPVASEHNVAVIRTAKLGPVSLGQFHVDRRKFGKDGRITLRGEYLGSPYEGSFGEFLRESIKTELAAAGIYRVSADTVLTATLSESHLEVGGFGPGSGSLKGRFIVTSKGVVVYDREIGLSETWESSFGAAVAVPRAVEKYENFYQKMVMELFNDPRFRDALRARP